MTSRKRAFTAIAATSSSGLVTLAMIVLATTILSPREQGFFFAFISLGTLVFLSDFGLSYSVLQRASYLDRASRETLLDFERQTRRWSLSIAALSTGVTGIIGYMSFSALTPDLQSGAVNWVAPWGLGLAGLFIVQCANPVISLIEGKGRVVAAWRIRMLQEWIGGIACVAALLLGWGLFGISLYWCGRALVALPLLIKHETARSIMTDTSPGRVNWRHEIWPFQWRIGLSSLSGFLIFRAFPLLLLAEQGPVSAGQYGFALGAMNMMLTVTTSWPNSQAARLGQLLASGAPLAAIAEANKTLKRSSLFAAFAALAAWGAFGVAEYLDLEIARRITDLDTLAIIFATGFVHHMIFCQAVLLRAEVKEPLLAISVFGGIATITAAFFAARFGSMQTLAVVVLACALFGLAVSTYLFSGLCSKWRKEQSSRPGSTTQ